MFPLGCRDAGCSVRWVFSFFTTEFTEYHGVFIFGDVSFPLSTGDRGVLENTHVNNKVDKVDVYCTPLTISEGIK